MPKDYITKEEFAKEMSFIKKFMEEQRVQFERNVGAIAENFLDQVKMLAEGVQMQIEKVEMLRIENSSEHQNFDMRINRLESKVLFGKRKTI